MVPETVSRRRWLGLALAALAAAGPQHGLAQGVELLTLRAERADGAVVLEFATRVTLPRAVEEALYRGVPVYFVAQATLWRNRWYWRDERVARVSRTWRLAYQPLTSTWRVSLGGLSQTVGSLAEAMGIVTRTAQWRLVDLADIDPGSTYNVEFTWRLDTSQLPGPMQIGLGGQADFTLGVERTQRLE